MNKVVCFRSENHPATGKGQRTPREWLEHSDRDKYEAVCQRAKKLPYPKYKRFLRKNAKVDDFIDRQLNDTRYIAKATVEYLKCLFEHEANKRGVVLGLKGQLTATLRRQWGLETVLQELPDSPGWQDEKAGKLRPGEKNRADHRHHAIDAAVLAMTNRSRLQKLAKGFTVDEFLDKETGELEYRDFYRGKRFDPPWDGFRDDVKLRLEEVNVSHRVERKIRGSLHKKKFYGPTSEEDEWVVRKPLADLSPNEIERIRDKTIRQLVEKTLTENGIEFGRSKNPNEKKMKEVLSKMAMPSGVPIKNVRIIKKEQTIQPVREGQAGEAYVKPGSTHHLCIFEWEEKGKVKRDAVFVTMLEAIERLKRQQQELARSVAEWKKSGLSNKEIRHRKRRAMSDIAKRFPIIERTPPQDHFDIPSDAQFVMSLSGREMVLANWSGEEKLLTYKTATSTNGKITFADQADARKSKEYKRYNVAANKTVDRAIRKVTVDPLGRIRWAND